MRTADGFLLVFDISKVKSFEDLNEFHKQIVRSKDCDFPPIMLVGNKVDVSTVLSDSNLLIHDSSHLKGEPLHENKPSNCVPSGKLSTLKPVPKQEQTLMKLSNNWSRWFLRNVKR